MVNFRELSPDGGDRGSARFNDFMKDRSDRSDYMLKALRGRRALDMGLWQCLGRGLCRL